jgi:DNA-binding NtrC family response regulator
MRNILVIDDNLMILALVSSCLSLMLKDYTILTAEDGQIGIATMESHQVSLILTDLEMPKMDGYQVINYAKKNHPDVPLIVMTGSWSFDLNLLVSRMGAVHCIEKPLHLGELAQIVTEALGQDHGRETENIIEPCSRIR